MNDLIHDKSKEIVNLQNIIIIDKLSYNFNECPLPNVCLRDIHEEYLSLEVANNE